MEAVRIYQETEGVVDVAAGPLFDLWGFGFRNGEFPSDNEVEKIRKGSGMRRLKNSIHEAVSKDGTIRSQDLLLSEDMAKDGLPTLNYTAIAQGYSCDLVADYLYRIGVKD